MWHQMLSSSLSIATRWARDIILYAGADEMCDCVTTRASVSGTEGAQFTEQLPQHPANKEK
jgi:hypothetical protein